MMTKKIIIFVSLILISVFMYNETIFIVYSGNTEENSIFVKYFKNRTKMDFALFNTNNRSSNISNIIGKITVEKPFAILLAGDYPINEIAPFVDDVPLILSMSDNIPKKIMEKDNVCGILSDYGIDTLACYIKKTFPDYKHFGIVFHIDYSLEYAKNMKTICDSQSLNIELGNISSKEDIKMTVKMLKATGCKMIFFPNDDFFMDKNNFSKLLNEAKKVDIPLISINRKYIKKDILGSFVYNVYNAGYQAGNIALRLKNGELCKDIGFINSGGLHLIYNEKIRKKYKIKIDPKMLEKAEQL